MKSKSNIQASLSPMPCEEFSINRQLIQLTIFQKPTTDKRTDHLVSKLSCEI